MVTCSLVHLMQWFRKVLKLFTNNMFKVVLCCIYNKNINKKRFLTPNNIRQYGHWTNQRPSPTSRLLCPRGHHHLHFKLNYPSTDHNHVIKPVRVQSNSSPPAKKRLKENVGVEPSLLTYSRETRRLLHVSGSHNFPVHTHSNMTMKSG